MYLNTFKNQPVEELQNERTTVEKHFTALTTKYLKHKNQIHSCFFTHGMQEELFSFPLLSVADVRGRQPSFPPSFPPALSWVEGRQVAPFPISSPEPAQEHRHKAVTFFTTAFVTVAAEVLFC